MRVENSIHTTNSHTLSERSITWTPTVTYLVGSFRSSRLDLPNPESPPKFFHDFKSRGPYYSQIRRGRWYHSLHLNSCFIASSIAVRIDREAVHAPRCGLTCTSLRHPVDEIYVSNTFFQSTRPVNRMHHKARAPQTHTEAMQPSLKISIQKLPE